ncbi:MAG TPA: helix-turn-helix domain-containing protein [Chloroflexota bacterium]|nr:helix-turn-helix domain-containing protein [Chloroflexota bacterium]
MESRESLIRWKQVQPAMIAAGGTERQSPVGADVADIARRVGVSRPTVYRYRELANLQAGLREPWSNGMTQGRYFCR